MRKLQKGHPVHNITIYIFQFEVVPKVYKSQVNVGERFDDETLWLENIASVVEGEQFIVSDTSLEGHGISMSGALGAPSHHWLATIF